MSQFTQELQTYFYHIKEPVLCRKKADDMTAVAFIIRNFMNIMFDEIERVGITNIEFLAKSELFLRAVTASYPTQSFNQVLEVLRNIDNKIEETYFYYGLKSLRAITTNEFDANIEIFNAEGTFFATFTKQQTLELSFFIAYLIESIIKYCQEVRKLHASKFMNSQDFKRMIDKKFEILMLEAINIIGQITIV